MSAFTRLVVAAHLRSRGWLATFVISTAAIAAQNCAAYAQLENSISVTIQPTTTALPLVVADKKGMFSKNNVAVKWSVSQVPISDSIAALGRQFDVVMGTQPALIAAAGQGLPVVVITGGGLDTAKIPTSKIVAREGSDIKTFQHLDGKTIGTLTLTGNIHFALLNILQKQGVDLSNIRWVTGAASQLPDLLKAGRVNAIEEIEPFATGAIAAGGVDLGEPFRSVSDRAFIGIWLSERSWASKNKDLILRFSKALDEAAKWIVDNNAEAKEILSAYTGLKGVVLEKTPIPEFHFSTTSEDLNKQLRPDLSVWLDILRRTSDFPPVGLDTLLPNWEQD
jgi:ABC-type nitrate/sulfonate/bicarbonate transport system substrate-binding protein